MTGRLLFLAGALLLGGGWFVAGHLPARTALLPGVLQEPEQTATRERPFDTRVNGVDYRIKPLFDYDMTGLVVSLHHSDAWWDWIHAATNDHINIVDLCVVWGANADAAAYKKMDFSSGQFICYYQYGGAADIQPAHTRALSNNHLLTDNPQIARQLRSMRIGDQIRLRGPLVEYSHNAGMAYNRGSSTSRDDTGNGACETIFVRDATVLRRRAQWPVWMQRAGVLLLLAALAAALLQPYRSRH